MKNDLNYASGMVSPFNTSKSGYISYGLSKRELFAVMAMQSFITTSDSFNEEMLDKVKKRSVLVADLLLEKLNS